MLLTSLYLFLAVIKTPKLWKMAQKIVTKFCKKCVIFGERNPKN